jgi:tetratricopeptide (TPR) repeat protein
LLLLVERLALAAGDVPGALATYDALLGAAIGPHGRRTLQYRAGRWLENAGRPREALARFLDAFALAPSMGVAYRAAERLAEAAGDHRALERLYATLAAATRDTALRFELTRRVGELLLDRLDEPERGFATLLEANALSESFALDDTLRERARAWLRQSSPIAAAALETLRRHWEERVENLWEARARIACLRKLAVLLTEDFGDAPAAFDYLDRATAIAKEEQVEDSVLADLERDLTALQARSQAGGGPPMERRSYAGTVASPRQSRVPGAPQATPAVSAQAREDPREAAQREPWRIDLWKQLALERFDAFPALGLVARALLSVVEGAAPGDDRRDFTRAWRGIALDTVIGPTYPDALGALLSQIWQRARVLPRFRFAIEQFGVSARDRLTRLSTGMVSDAYAEAAQTLGIHVAVYASDAADPPVRALPTYPTCLVTTPHLTGSPAERAYAVAHALWLTRGEHVISALLAEHEARLLLDAFIAAFGSGRSSGAADRERMELAAQFWQTIPARDQQVLAALVRAHAAQLDYPALRGAAHAAAARAGLCVSGDVAVALRATLADAGISTAPLDPARLETACGSSPAVAEVVRCALSREFLSATARAYGVA